MTQENKELLLKDLCARLPYGVMLNIKGQDGLKPFDFDETLYDIFLDGNYLSINNRGSGDNPGICEIKPYLRPKSSMTIEEKLEYSTFGFSITEHINANRDICPTYNVIETKEVYAISFIMDWLNAHYFDYRGLIEKNLALDCTGLHIYD